LRRRFVILAVTDRAGSINVVGMQGLVVIEGACPTPVVSLVVLAGIKPTRPIPVVG
jgi:hypothetical protein